MEGRYVQVQAIHHQPHQLCLLSLQSLLTIVVLFPVLFGNEYRIENNNVTTIDRSIYKDLKPYSIPLENYYEDENNKIVGDS